LRYVLFLRSIHEEIDHRDAISAGIARSDFGGEVVPDPQLLIDAEQQANVFHADAGPFQLDVDFVHVCASARYGTSNRCDEKQTITLNRRVSIFVAELLKGRVAPP
jgi:hypothetical protein